jgi:hypothetical protein
MNKQGDDAGIYVYSIKKWLGISKKKSKNLKKYFKKPKIKIPK